MGSPFKWGGKSPEEGFDCWGLVVEIYKRLGVDIEATLKYQGPESAPREVPEGVERAWEPVRGALEVWDVITFAPLREGDPPHVGVYVGNLRVVEATPQFGVVARRIGHRKILGVYRWRG